MTVPLPPGVVRDGDGWKLEFDQDEVLPSDALPAGWTWANTDAFDFHVVPVRPADTPDLPQPPPYPSTPTTERVHIREVLGRSTPWGTGIYAASTDGYGSYEALTVEGDVGYYDARRSDGTVEVLVDVPSRPADTPEPTCATCNDTGAVRDYSGPGLPEPMPCPDCPTAIVPPTDDPDECWDCGLPMTGPAPFNCEAAHAAVPAEPAQWTVELVFNDDGTLVDHEIVSDDITLVIDRVRGDADDAARRVAAALNGSPTPNLPDAERDDHGFTDAEHDTLVDLVVRNPDRVRQVLGFHDEAPTPNLPDAETIAETLRTTFGHPPITDTPGAVIGERWMRAARAILALVAAPTEDTA